MRYPDRVIQRTSAASLDKPADNPRQDDAQKHDDGPRKIQSDRAHSDWRQNAPHSLDRRIGHGIDDLGNDEQKPARSPVSSKRLRKVKDQPRPHNQRKDIEGDVGDRRHNSNGSHRKETRTLLLRKERRLDVGLGLSMVAADSDVRWREQEHLVRDTLDLAEQAL